MAEVIVKIKVPDGESIEWLKERITVLDLPIKTLGDLVEEHGPSKSLSDVVKKELLGEYEVKSAGY